MKIFFKKSAIDLSGVLPLFPPQQLTRCSIYGNEFKGLRNCFTASSCPTAADQPKCECERSAQCAALDSTTMRTRFFSESFSSTSLSTTTPSPNLITPFQQIYSTLSSSSDIPTTKTNTIEKQQSSNSNPISTGILILIIIAGVVCCGLIVCLVIYIVKKKDSNDDSIRELSSLESN